MRACRCVGLLHIHGRGGSSRSLAWALTVHRMQGLTLARRCGPGGCHILAGPGGGQVALSRVRTLEGLALCVRPCGGKPSPGGPNGRR